MEYPRVKEIKRYLACCSCHSACISCPCDSSCEGAGWLAGNALSLIEIYERKIKENKRDNKRRHLNEIIKRQRTCH